VKDEYAMILSGFESPLHAPQRWIPPILLNTQKAKPAIVKSSFSLMCFNENVNRTTPIDLEEDRVRNKNHVSPILTRI
jgi:hypothetical protein